MDAQISLSVTEAAGLERDYRGLGISDGVLKRTAVPGSGRRHRRTVRARPLGRLALAGRRDRDLARHQRFRSAILATSDEKKWLDEYDAFLAGCTARIPPGSDRADRRRDLSLTLATSTGAGDCGRCARPESVLYAIGPLPGQWLRWSPHARPTCSHGRRFRAGFCASFSDGREASLLPLPCRGSSSEFLGQP